jgi:hypothetical protein
MIDVVLKCVLFAVGKMTVKTNTTLRKYAAVRMER